MSMEAEQLRILADSGLNPSDQPFLKPGKWWHRDGEKIVCDLCPRECHLGTGDRGFCFVRQNIGGEMMLTTYGRSTGFCIDPIEKKPLNHFYPGTSVLSFGTAGCNLGCKFCQNWDISKSREVARLSERAGPEDIANAAKSLGCKSVAYTYNDPIIWAEYAMETAKACRAVGVKSVAVTAGYICPSARNDFFQDMDAANVDLKAFDEDFYTKITLSHIQPVLDTLSWLKAETDVWFEITNLIIPQANDSANELERMCGWILNAVGDDVPVHFSAFHPDYRMRDRGPTPPETLIMAREIALNTGLKYVYVGNVNDVHRQSTYCPGCGTCVIERNWYELGSYALDGNRCRACQTEIAGHFDLAPGDWGRKRQPVDMRQFTTPQSSDSVPPSSQTPTRKEHATMPSSNLEVTPLQSEMIVQAAAKIFQAAVFERSTDIPANELFGKETEDLASRMVSGVFVTAKRNGQLRSCCGNLGQEQPLLSLLTQAAVRTATDDPRFPPVSVNELPFLELDVWLLGPLEPVNETGADRISAVEVGKHGLQIVRGQQRGLLLPGVATENNWDAEEFLNRVCLKAGLPASAWRDDQTQLFRFAGSEHTGEIPKSEVKSPNPGAAVFSPRDIAAYAQFCGQTLRTLLSGSTPLYYCPSVSDGNVNGISLRTTVSGTTNELITTRLNLKQTMPLQATGFALCEELARVLAQNQIPPSEVQLSLTILTDPNMHGTVAAPDLRGLESGDRAVLVLDGNRRAWVFDDEKSAEELLDDAIGLCGVNDPTVALVMSLHVVSSKSRGQVVDRPQAMPGTFNRPAAVAGTFYPGTKTEIEKSLDEMLPKKPKKSPCRAAMVPHAGWEYSGQIAANVLASIKIPETVMIISPKHTPNGVDWAVAPCAKWSFPSGELLGDPDLAKLLVERITGLELDAAAHQREHGIEVELPILHRLAPNTRVVGITIGSGNLDRLNRFAEQLSEVLKELDSPPLILISSDMNHFATDAETRRLDEMALATLDDLNPEELYHTTVDNHISMCGMRPAVIALNALNQISALKESERLGYATTADVTGDSSRVVGYAGMIFR